MIMDVQIMLWVKMLIEMSMNLLYLSLGCSDI